MSYKISVIVPIYGVEQYIERCARSLFEQTLDAIEFIFVDDCTTDNSMAVLHRVIADYPQRKDHVTIIKHETNKGLPQARKTGVQVAKGEYVAHCDSDDWVECNMYEVLYEYATSGHYDVVYSDYFVSDGTHNFPKCTKTSKRLIQGPIWNKLVNRALYTENEIVYPTANKAEDGALMTQLSYYAKQIGYMPKPLYHYFANPQSMTRILSEGDCIKRMEQEKENTLLRVSFLDSLRQTANYKTDVIEWKWLTRNNLLPHLRKNKFYKLWLSTYPEINKDLLLNRGITLRAKVVFLLQLSRLYSFLKR